ncbi:hypothetical protein KGF57_001821 [Candida theae]|uniref:WHIM1 domain-containing protein n=1 Tax=Candida theae TaxID=1198502 RepID=A0AAD5BG55_9ASCO|nr:uncharacterized protein KGF57_001821 [Candida theae]KAI5960889.1 hypothetical protein KGF57_001821 [Candida theae]
MDSNIDPEVAKSQPVHEDDVGSLEEQSEVQHTPNSNNNLPTFAEENNASQIMSSGSAEAALTLLNDLRPNDQSRDAGTGSIPPAEYMDIISKMELQKPEMLLVQYDPDGKPLRLGRPRKHITRPPSPPETSSDQNYNQSIMSKFRFDSQPVEGPGSRGGKNLRKETRGKITSDAVKKRQQSILNFAVAEPNPANSEATNVPTEGENNDHKQENNPVKLFIKAPEKTDSQSPAPQQKRQKLRNSLNPMRRALEKRNPKALPSPLIPVSAAEDFLIRNDESRLASNTQLALGYPIQKAPYANDIMYLVLFLTKFREVIPFKNLGPKSFEQGLCLPPLRQQDESSRYNLRSEFVEKDDDYDISSVSPEMEDLFKRLLTLVLNRKKDVASASGAISELKPQSARLGLPKEWRVYSPSEKEAYDAGEPVDPAHPEILITKFPNEPDYVITFNPFYTNDFESKGLRGLSNPLDRLLVLKTLAQWSLSTSDSIKSYIAQNVQNQELPGEKDTYYASRALLYGFDDCKQAKAKADARLAKMKSTEEDLKYVDPTSDPTAHSMNIRLVDHLVGDLGFYGGRFYLCRMADGNNGGLTSVNKMSTVFRGQDVGLGSLPPSDFKLYVQDTHSISKGAAKADGVEFDENGNEVDTTADRNFDDSEHWYEVASNATELKEFVAYLSKKLYNRTKYSVGSDLHQSTSRFHAYLSRLLPLIEAQEQLQTTSRQKRKRTIDYSDSRAAARYDDAFGAVGDDVIVDDGYDDDNYIDDDVPEAIESEGDEEYID